MSRKRFPSGDTIKNCSFCGCDLTGTDKTYCDSCLAEISPEVLGRGSK